MLQIDYPHNGRNDRIKHYSDAGMMIEQTETGILYSEAVDVYPCKYTYTETETPIEIEIPPEDETYSEGETQDAEDNAEATPDE